MPDENNVHIAGNGNVLIQGCELSTITVTTLDTERFEELLAQSLQEQMSTVQILVLSAAPRTLADHVVAFLGNMPAKLSAYYGNELTDWKPLYGESAIGALLYEYQEKSGFQLRVFFVDASAGAMPQKVLNKLRLRKQNTILLVDALALSFDENRKIAAVFDDYQTGGCLVVVPDEPDLQQLSYGNVQKAFPALSDYLQSYAEEYLEERMDNGFVHIDLNINDKNLFFRRLTHIATLHLDPLPSRRFADLDGIGLVPVL